MGSYKADYNKIPNDISSWTVSTHLTNNDSYKLGDYYFYHYIYTFNNDGTIKQIQANDNHKSQPKDPY